MHYSVAIILLTLWQEFALKTISNLWQSLQVIDLFLQVHKHTNSISKLTDEIGNLNTNFKTLESDNGCGKKVNDALE